MSSSIFQIHQHTIPTCHIREYPRALAEDQEDVCQLAVKQYTPKKRHAGTRNEVTIIGAHANGFPKVSIFGRILLLDVTQSEHLSLAGTL